MKFSEILNQRLFYSSCSLAVSMWLAPLVWACYTPSHMPFTLQYGVLLFVVTLAPFLLSDLVRQDTRQAIAEKRLLPTGEWVVANANGTPCFLPGRNNLLLWLTGLGCWLAPPLCVLTYWLQQRNDILNFMGLWAAIILVGSAYKLVLVRSGLKRIAAGKLTKSGHRQRRHRGTAQILVEVDGTGQKKWILDTGPSLHSRLYAEKLATIGGFEALRRGHIPQSQL